MENRTEDYEAAGWHLNLPNDQPEESENGTVVNCMIYPYNDRRIEMSLHLALYTCGEFLDYYTGDDLYPPVYWKYVSPLPMDKPSDERLAG